MPISGQEKARAKRSIGGHEAARMRPRGGQDETNMRLRETKTAPRGGQQDARRPGSRGQEEAKAKTKPK